MSVELVSLATQGLQHTNCWVSSASLACGAGTSYHAQHKRDILRMLSWMLCHPCCTLDSLDRLFLHCSCTPSKHTKSLSPLCCYPDGTLPTSSLFCSTRTSKQATQQMFFFCMVLACLEVLPAAGLMLLKTEQQLLQTCSTHTITHWRCVGRTNHHIVTIRKT